MKFNSGNSSALYHFKLFKANKYKELELALSRANNQTLISRNRNIILALGYRNKSYPMLNFIKNICNKHTESNNYPYGSEKYLVAENKIHIFLKNKYPQNYYSQFFKSANINYQYNPRKVIKDKWFGDLVDEEQIINYYDFEFKNTRQLLDLVPTKYRYDFYGSKYNFEYFFNKNKLNKEDLLQLTVEIIRFQLNEALDFFISENQNVPTDVDLIEMNTSKSQKTLFNEIKSSFPNEIIIEEGQPPFLEIQRFDIWFPERKIAIEFQGEQHFSAIDFFGGEKGFEKQKKLDEEKRLKCKTNRITLIEVKKGYDLKEIIFKIDQIIEAKPI